MLVLAVSLIPAFAITGLSLPLPAAVERIAAALVPWAEGAAFSEQPVAAGAAGSIVLTSAERRSGSDAAARRDAGRDDASGGAESTALPSATRRATSPKPAAPAAAGARTTPAAPTERSGTRPEQSGAGSDPAPTTPVLIAVEEPRASAATPPPATVTQPKLDPLPVPVPEPPPAVTQPPNVVPAPVQQVVEQTLGTVAQTTQTTVDNTVPALSETVAPVTGIVSNPIGAVGGLAPRFRPRPSSRPLAMLRRRLESSGDPPRLVLRFAISTAIALALAAAAILLVVRHFDTVQAERGATAQARVLASTVLRESLEASDFVAPVTGPRRSTLDELFANRVLDEGVVLAALVTDDGTIAYSTDHRLVGSRLPQPEHVREARRGIVRGDVTTVGSGDRELKALRTYAPVAVPGGTGVVVIYQDYAPIARAANATFLPVAGIFEVALILLFIALVPILRRVTLRLRRQMDEIQRRADYDELTGLPNRTLFKARIEDAIDASEPAGSAVMVMLLDVDRFKEVNDALGHDTGDLLLRQLSSRLAALCEGEAAARLGGDEFGILLLDASIDEAMRLADRIHGSLESPFDLQGFSLEIATSIGIAVHREHGDDAETLLQHADVAMYLAKAAHEGTAVYDAEQDTNDKARLVLAGELRRAIENDELVVHYQPKAELETGRIVGVEALVRWLHPERGFIPPNDFIPIAERTGLIKPLSLYVLAAAVVQCRRWSDDGLDLHVAVNLTIPDLLDLELPDRISVLLEETGVAAEQLELELTETTLLADPSRVCQVLDRLNAMGVRLAIDDFGTGYSSLAYLKRLPVQTIKIDRSFVIDMLENSSDAAIVRSTIDLARNLGLRVVAEGVENMAAWELLRQQGCTLAQGYMISRPAPADELADLLAERGATRRRKRAVVGQS